MPGKNYLYILLLRLIFIRKREEGKHGGGEAEEVKEKSMCYI